MNTQGKKNRLKVGDRVMMTPSALEWFITHLVESYSVHGEIHKPELPCVGGWIHAHLTETMPTGTVVGYGIDEDDHKGYSFVKVEFKLKYGTRSGYHSEKKHLRKIS